MKSILHRSALAISFAAGATLLLTAPASGASPSWTWSVGPVIRFGTQIEVTGSSYAQDGAFSDAGPAITDPAAIGTTSAVADRTYSNGFVRLDPGTNPEGGEPVGGAGLTWNWGYDGAGQYAPAGDGTLSFAASGERTATTTTLNAPAVADEDPTAWGLTVTGAVPVYRSGQLRVDLAVGGTLFARVSSEFGYSSYAQQYDRYATAITDTYNLGGVVPPAAPYAGTFDGPGPVIPNQPATRTRVDTGPAAGGTGNPVSWTAANDVQFDTRTQSFAVTVGPRVVWPLSDAFELGGSVHGSAGYDSLDVERSEQFISDKNGVVYGIRESGSTSGPSFGVGAALSGLYRLSESISIEARAGYEWTATETELEVGPSRVEYDSSGWQAALLATFAY